MGAPQKSDDWFGRNFRAAREASGLSQAEVAQRMRDRGFIKPRYEQQTVTNIETGNRGVRLNEAIALARIVNVDNVEVLHAAPGDTVDARRLIEARHQVTHAERALSKAAQDYEWACQWFAKLAREADPATPREYLVLPKQSAQRVAAMAARQVTVLEGDR